MSTVRGDGSTEILLVQKIQDAAAEILESQVAARDALDTLRLAATRANAATALIEGWVDGALNEALEPVCPTCGASAVLRSGRHGVFYGCTQYPKCNGVLDVAEWRTKARYALAERMPGAGRGLDIPPSEVPKILGGERIPWDDFLSEVKSIFQSAHRELGAGEDVDELERERARIEQIEQSVLARLEATRGGRKTVDLPAMRGGHRRNKNK